MKSVIVTGGPIPGQLDSVKYITNRFKGGLSLKTALYLKSKGFDVTFICWEFLDLEIPSDLKTLRIKNVHDYYEKVLSIKADAYILSAAVANLVPKNPYETKFPSHLYKPGDVFNIEFEIAPRVIDAIKQKYPYSSLIAYKLYDGTPEELLKAAFKTLYDSRANLVFANSPRDCKNKKTAVTADGSIIPCDFQEHLDLICKQLACTYFKTQQIYKKGVPFDIQKLFEKFEPLLENDQAYGCLAVRFENGMFCSGRGKSKLKKEISFVSEVDYLRNIVFSDQKATLNAPLLFKIFKENPSLEILWHQHDLKQQGNPLSYIFPGTNLELIESNPSVNNSAFEIIQPFHGTIRGFTSRAEFEQKIEKI